MKLSVIIPVYNEEKTVKNVIRRVSEVGMDKEIIVVNDGSTDATSEELSGIADTDIKIINLEKNRGKSAAVRRGIQESSGELIIIQDADLEYDPSDYSRLLEAYSLELPMAVYGNRFPLSGKKMFLRQRAANKVLTLMTDILYFSRVGDMETCYKLLPGDILRNMELKEERFGIEAEVTSKLLKAGVRIVGVPIEYSPRDYSEGKKIRFKDFLQAVLILIKLRFRRSVE